MALPVIPLPQSSVEVGGVSVSFRSLSRKDAVYVSSGVFKNDPDAAEKFILSKGVGITEAEAAAWREVTDPIEAGKLVDGIIYLSGLAPRPKEKTEGESESPKA